MVRRSLDILASAIGLFVLSPLLLSLAVAIKLASPGPVFYRGLRVGRHGKPFRIFKFRSMVANAERIGGPSTSDMDPRISSVGRLMRKYKLDELPQLINVIRGEMSLVGPRPQVPEYVARYSDEERLVLQVRPGITDWASIWNADEGAILALHADPDRAYDELIHPTKMRLQLMYVRHHSLWVDVKIIVYTLLKLARKSWLPPEIRDYPWPGREYDGKQHGFETVTELPGAAADAEQISMLYTRYAWAGALACEKDVLEVACGSGIGLGHLAARAKRVVGGDCDPKLAELARRQYNGRIAVHQFDAHTLPFPDASFDLVGTLRGNLLSRTSQIVCAGSAPRLAVRRIAVGLFGQLRTSRFQRQSLQCPLLFCAGVAEATRRERLAGEDVCRLSPRSARLGGSRPSEVPCGGREIATDSQNNEMESSFETLVPRKTAIPTRCARRPNSHNGSDCSRGRETGSSRLQGTVRNWRTRGGRRARRGVMYFRMSTPLYGPTMTSLQAVKSIARKDGVTTGRRVPFFDYPQVFLSDERALTEIFIDVGRRGAFIQQRDLEEFEDRLAEYVGAKHVLGIANATDALHLALRAVNVGPGDEVIFCSHTMVATAAAVHFAGGTPVPVDCGTDHLIDASKIEAAITPRTKVILPTQLNGRTADMDAIQSIAQQHNLDILEDAAQALGSKFKGRCAGTFGVVSCVSFYPAKTLGCFGDGGCVITNDDEMYRKLRLLRDHGRDEQGEVQMWGLNSRLDNLQAAILNRKLDLYDEAIARRRQIASLYHRHLSDVAEIVLPPPPASDPNHFDVFQNYELEAERREELRAHLKSNGVESSIPWGGKAVHQFRGLGFTQRLPFTEALFQHVLLLPMNTFLDDRDVLHVCDCIRDFYGTKPLDGAA